MGRLYTRGTKSNHLYFKDKNKSDRSTFTTDVNAAKRFRANLEQEEEFDTISTVQDALYVWEEKMHKEHRFTKQHKSIVRKINSFFGDFEPTEIPRIALTKYKDMRVSRDGVQPQTAEKELSTLMGAINVCEKLGHSKSKANFTVQKSKQKTRDRYLTTDEMRAIMNSKNCKMYSGFKMCLQLALKTCARKTAIRELKFSQIDFDTNILDYDSDTNQVNRKPRAKILLKGKLRDELFELQSINQSGYVCEVAGKRMTNHFLDARWREVREEVGLNKNTNKEDAVFHSLRHTGAVHMARAKFPLLSISNYLGHTNIRITQKVYAKYHPEFMTEEADFMDNLYD